MRIRGRFFTAAGALATAFLSVAEPVKDSPPGGSEAAPPASKERDGMEKKGVHDLPETVVTAERPSPSAGTVRSVKSSGSLISEGKTAGEMVKHLPSVMMGGPPGESKDARLRGMDKEFTSILVDGRRFPDGGEKREVKLDRIPMDLVERIELIRNPSAEYGGHGIAGTINILLKRPPPGTEFRTKALYGTDGQRDLFGSVGLSKGRWDLLVAANHLLESPEKDKREHQ